MFLQAAQWIDTNQDGLPDAWETLQLGSLAGGPEEDPDRDGQVNFTEFAFGTDPRQATSASSFQTGFLRDGADRFFEVRFHRRAGWDVSYVIEQSPDLVHWGDATGAGDLREPMTNLFDRTGTGRTTFVLTTPADSSPRAFVRVRALPTARNLTPPANR